LALPNHDREKPLARIATSQLVPLSPSFQRTLLDGVGGVIWITQHDYRQSMGWINQRRYEGREVRPGERGRPRPARVRQRL